VAPLRDPHGLFNSSLDGGVRRAIDLQQGNKRDDQGLTAVIREAVATNLAAKTG
jgi:hypothetical protein